MLTGNNEATARAIAEKTGISHFEAEVMPGQKSAYGKALQSEEKIVAKTTIISSDLNKIPDAIGLSKSTVRTIRQNLFWAFIYNLIGIPVAAGILFPFTGFLLNPMLAGAAMALSSVSVVSNSLRLKLLR